MTSFDHQRASLAIGAALAGPGGVGQVVRVFCGVPGVILTPARRGLFRSAPERVQIGDWRYEVTADGRLSTGHVVNGIVLAEEVLPAGAVGAHIVRALAQVVGSYGPTIIPNIDAAVEVLEAAPRY
ncbi:DUF5073 family protein [Mycobacterium montefiorense]|uniref:DUF5073 domain-containing protein n=1 Tax=Mycobacterium montefiorense TaxID=154654 RepID=A0AA37PJ69_9MYCO|nr:DUF5073 family protein [Mycobacterium montefiorense]MCV7429911.1 DUF5073 family protein [Mycobacterium montefiorense]GBG38824.1 DUF5073 domain-containing protein [Mycobacterium montefiorense]GKU34652.1 DUF5073 domain-containing protein [Mycobacterium montefiorense]GKU38133.1 DUF5073 domain-containing protein [Mycobacterium montefiorense]GKU43421.1 DUF5073 domain-containing protein [Mycobacterium montefiorense]